MAIVHLYSAQICPYAARTRLVLLEKKIPFEFTEIDLKAKPSWFAEVSPYSKVPVLKHGADLVWESSIINEYVEEVFPEPALMSADPATRARARFWIDFANVKFTPTWYRLLLAQSKDDQVRLSAELRAHFLFMESAGIGSAKGPYWLGERLSLVDLTYEPWFERIPVMEHYRGVGLPPECRRLRTLAESLMERPSVQSIALPLDRYIEGARSYADGTAAGTTARDMRQA